MSRRDVLGPEHARVRRDVGRLPPRLRIARAFAGLAVTLIAQPGNEERVFAGLRAGAVGVLGKDASATELIRGVLMLARGNALISADSVRRLVHDVLPHWLHHRTGGEQLAELTERERLVLALVAKGVSNTEIADHLVISPATAKTHVRHAMLKLGARHRAQLVVLAYERGLAQPRIDNPSQLPRISPGFRDAAPS